MSKEQVIIKALHSNELATIEAINKTKEEYSTAERSGYLKELHTNNLEIVKLYLDSLKTNEENEKVVLDYK